MLEAVLQIVFKSRERMVVADPDGSAFVFFDVVPCFFGSALAFFQMSKKIEEKVKMTWILAFLCSLHFHPLSSFLISRYSSYDVIMNSISTYV